MLLYKSTKGWIDPLSILDRTITAVTRASVSVTPCLTCVNIPPVTTTSLPSAPTLFLPLQSQSTFSEIPLLGWVFISFEISRLYVRDIEPGQLIIGVCWFTQKFWNLKILKTSFRWSPSIEAFQGC